MPVLFLPQNKYAYHQSTALVGFALALAMLLKKVIETKNRFSKFIVGATIGIFIALSIFSIDFTIKNSFVLLRAKIVEKVLGNFQREFPSLSEGSIVYIKNDPNYPEISEEWGSSSKQAFYILSGSDAFQLIYKDPSINVLYEDVDNNVKGVEYGSYYTLNATFPY